MALAESSRSYLESVFALSPLEHAEEIARRRRSRRNMPVRVSTAEHAHATREWAVDEVTALRTEFATLSAESLAQRLSDARLATFPDVALACARLRTYSEAKPRLEELQQRGVIDATFARVLELLFVLPTGRASRLRQELLSGLPSTRDMLRSSEHGIELHAGAAWRVAQRIARAAPNVYAHEREWLDTLRAIPGPWARWRNRWHRRQFLWWLLAFYLLVRAASLFTSGR
ncbi:MAG: hypothetical protein ACKVX7_09980 [Planctomycetota bacterium]